MEENGRDPKMTSFCCYSPCKGKSFSYNTDMFQEFIGKFVAKRFFYTSLKMETLIHENSTITH